MSTARTRSMRHTRHRSRRSALQGPLLPPIETRRARFARIVMDTADYLLHAWPNELAGVQVEISDVPAGDANKAWMLDRKHRRITFYRVPIERNMKRRRDTNSRQYIEFTVARALAEFAGNEP